MFGYKPVKDAIVAKLETISGLTVHGKEEKELKILPAACVSARGHNNEFHDLAANLKTVQHYVRIYFRTDETNDADYEDVLETMADSVITTLEHDVTLGGVVDWCIPTSGEWRNTEKQSPMRMLELVVTSKARVVR